MGNLGQASRLRVASDESSGTPDRGEDDAAFVELSGVRLLAWTEAQTVEHVFARLTTETGPRGGWIVTPNVDILRRLAKDAQARDVVFPATAGVADGMPLVWASRLQGTPLPERVTGASLLHTLSARAASHGIPVYLLGGAEGVSEEAARRLARKYPGLSVAGWSPPFGLEATRLGIEKIKSAIRAQGAQIVFCGFGFPKQEQLIRRLSADFPDVWFVGCGASLTFAAGRIDRAPIWMQHAGMEWVHRLRREPRRMFRRYVVHDLPFAVRLFANAALARVFKQSARRPTLVDLTSSAARAAALSPVAPAYNGTLVR